MIKIEEILEQGINRNASDIHLVVGAYPMLRISRELVPLDNFEIITNEIQNKFIEVFTENNEEIQNILKKQKILDIKYKYNEQNFRVNISYAMDLPICTIRIIKNNLPRFETLNLPQIVKDLTLKSQGLILVTGKPSSGKTTTLNALVNEINERQSKKIMILENPIEYIHVNKKSIIVQKEVGPFGDCLTYKDGVKNALREDCDVLVVGEIRDKETMDAAIEIAETGHLVIGTLHTNSCSETIDRIINFYDSTEHQTIKHILSGIIKLILSQRMLHGVFGQLVMVPEILVVDEQVSAIMKKEKYSSTEIEDAMLTGREKGNYGIVFSLADAVNANKITLDQALKEVDLRNQDNLRKLVKQNINNNRTSSFLFN